MTPEEVLAKFVLYVVAAGFGAAVILIIAAIIVAFIRDRKGR